MRKPKVLPILLAVTLTALGGCNAQQAKSTDTTAATVAKATDDGRTSESEITNRVSGTTPLEKIKAYLMQFPDEDGNPVDTSYMTDSMLIRENISHEAAERMGLEIYKLDLDEEHKNNVPFSAFNFSTTFAVGQNGVGMVSRLSEFSDIPCEDMVICDIDDDGENELTAYYTVGSGDVKLVMDVIEVKAGVPNLEYRFQISPSGEDSTLYDAFLTGDSVAVDEETQAIIVPYSTFRSDGDNGRGAFVHFSYAVKVQNGELTYEKTQEELTTISYDN